MKKGFDNLLRQLISRQIYMCSFSGMPPLQVKVHCRYHNRLIVLNFLIKILTSSRTRNKTLTLLPYTKARKAINFPTASVFVHIKAFAMDLRLIILEN